MTSVPVLPGLPPDALFLVANATLNAVVNNWPGSPILPLPDRQFVSNGLVAWDEPQLCVVVERMFPTDGDLLIEIPEPNAPLQGGRGIVIAVHLIREVPDVVTGPGEIVRVPSPDDLTASALDITTDMVVVWNCIYKAQRAGQIATCNSLAFADAVTVGPDGGMMEIITHVRMMLL